MNQTMILTETHLHTSEVSMCAVVSAYEISALYKDAGYGKIIVTDHYNRWTLDQFTGSNREKSRKWLTGYNIIKQTGADLGLDIFLGMELCLNSGPEDFLVYGMTADFLEEYPAIYNLTLEKAFKLLGENNMLIYQAHPFRPYLKPQNPLFLHGIEAYNGNPRHLNENHHAFEYARDYNLAQLAGSDYHHPDDLKHGGIYLPENIKENTQLVDYLKHNQPELFMAEDV